MNDRRRHGFLIFFSLLLIVATILGTVALIWQSNLAKARQLEAKAQIAEAQPDIIVARSQANINNAVALGTVKDSAMVVALIIIIIKDFINDATQPTHRQYPETG